MESTATMEFLPAVAAPSVSRDFLVVSIHDVAPASRELVDEMITMLGHRGVRVCSLLVVPDYHHQGLFTKDRQFVSWLRDLEVDGPRSVIHGYFHERPRRPEESLRDKFLTRFYTKHEGEFYDLDYEEALQRITQARDEFRAAGLTPRGFIAPAWLLGEAAERAATRSRNGIHHPADTRTRSAFGRRFRRANAVYSVRSRWRRAAAWLGTARSSGFCRVVPFAHKHSSARLFSSGDLAADLSI